ncbi:type II secretion system F family protein [uncultured Veillonella sp.]|uniref:type II secretion system F family protein n=1 Tax=uncultured Veillonella sp. TaxID=159268 RepID=UPI0025EE6D64|nr:type II secretion system F family protein [uncultured Veillonella sp.]
MKQFTYVVYDEKGGMQEDSLWAESVEEVKLKLVYRGWKIIRIESAKQSNHKRRHWSYKDVVEFSYRMNLLLEAGISIRRVMQFLSTRPSKHIPYALINESIQQGHQLSVVLEGTGFPLIGQALICAGEAAGTVGQSFKQVKSYYEKQLAWRRQLWGAATYPLFLFALMMVFLAVAIGFIIPSFKKVLLSMNVPLPWITKVLFQLGDFISAHLLLCLLGPLLVLLLSSMIFRRPAMKSRLAKMFWQWGAHHEWFDAFFLARMTEIWAILLESGVSMTELLRLSENLWGNSYATSLQKKVAQQVKEGASFSNALKLVGLGNEFLWELLLMGEESGSMVDMLLHCSQYYEQITKRYMHKAQQLMEPLMISLMGIGVAILVLAVMLPMFNSVTAIQGM